MPAEHFYDFNDVQGDPAAEDRRFTIRWGDSQPATAPVEIAGLPFDRSGLNRLIRVARTARDKAYGRDE